MSPMTCTGSAVLSAAMIDGEEQALAPSLSSRIMFPPHQKESDMMNNRILAIVLLVVGLILLFFAYQSSQSLGDQVTEAVTGRFTDSTTWFLILGAASAVAGVGLLLFGKSASN